MTYPGPLSNTQGKPCTFSWYGIGCNTALFFSKGQCPTDVAESNWINLALPCTHYWKQIKSERKKDNWN